MPIHQDLIDPDAQKVIHRLVKGRYQAYLVGGCVRDLLLDRKPKDFDIATSATPPQIKDLFRNCRIIGRRFRLAHIFFGQKIIETATFRANPREVEGDTDVEADAAPADLLIRRDNVWGNAEEDARRRDFTINGLFYDLEADQVIDYVGGLADLATRTVRTIGDPQIRFREDPVRILRAIKFAARLGFTIEESAFQAAMAHKVEIPKCPAPRVLEELYRLMREGAARRSMELLRDTGILDLLLPEIARLDEAGLGVFWHALDRLDASVRAGRPPTNAVSLCALLAPFVGALGFFEDDAFEGASEAPARVRDIGQYIEERSQPIVERMRASRRDVERARLMLLAQRRIGPSKRRRGRPMSLVRRDYFREALHVYELLAPVLVPGLPVDEEVARWASLVLEAEQRGEGPDEAGPHAGPMGASAADGGEDARRKRRRRRGGRNRRRPAGASGVAGANSGDPS